MKSTLVFLSGFGFQELLLFLLVIALCIGIFLALRAIVLWYWKIDSIVNNQQAQISLLKELISAVNRLNKP